MSTNLIKINQSRYGFLDFGAAKAESVVAGRTGYEKFIAEGRHGGMSYLERNIDKRFDPRLLVPGAESVLCFLAPYGRSGGGVAGFAQGVDYHKVVKDRLFAVIEDLKGQFPGFSGRPFVDSAPVLERYWAVKASLGFIGRNRLFISPRHGLRVIIGVIVCNIPSERFPPHAPLEASSCGDCGACSAACPGGALGGALGGAKSEARGFDARKCLSYHTIESREPLPGWMEGLSRWRFGCEECMLSCPWDKPLDPLPEMETHRERIAQLADGGWAHLSPEAFAAEFGDSGLMRAGLDRLCGRGYTK